MSEPCDTCKHADTDICDECPQSDPDGRCCCSTTSMPPCGWCEGSKWDEKDCNNCKHPNGSCFEVVGFCSSDIKEKWILKETETIIKGNDMDKNYQAKVFVRDEDGSIVACLSDGKCVENPTAVKTLAFIAVSEDVVRYIIDTEYKDAIAELKKIGKVVYDIAPFPASN